MKLLKLFPVALAAFALASCSSEDFESSKVQQDVANKGDLRIIWDTIDDGEQTRALADNKFNGPKFEAGDQVFVYDVDMHSTDIYAFKNDAFYFDPQFENDAPIIESSKVAYAVYPGKFWDFKQGEEVLKAPKGYVLRTEVGTPTCVDIKIPRVLRYKETADGYGYEFPFFGDASYVGTPGEEGTYIKADHFRALTARLRVRLDKAFGNVSYLKLSNTAGKPLSGTLTAKLYTGAKRTESMLQVVDEDYAVNTDIFIDLRNVPSDRSYIYIPVVCGPDYDHLLTGDGDGLTLKYIADRTVEDPTTVPDASWTDTGMKFPGEVFSPNSRHAGQYAFELTNMNPKKISDILAQYKSSTTDITLDLKAPFTIDASDKNVDNVVYLPKFDKEDMKITINIVAPYGVGDFVNTKPDVLCLKNAEGVEKTNATVILNTGIITPDADGLNLSVDAPGAKVQVIGDFSGQTKLTLANADKFTFGDGTNATDFTGLTSIDWGKKDAGVKDIVIAAKAKVKALATVNLGETINETVTVDGELDAAGCNVSFAGKTRSFKIGATGEVKVTSFGATNSEKLELIEVAGKLTASANVNTAKNYATALVVKDKGIVSAAKCIVNNIASTISVKDEGKITGEIDAKTVITGNLFITSKTDKAVEGNVTIGGNVTVDMQDEDAKRVEGEAITGTLEMQGANKTLALVSGYINTVKINTQNAGTWEQKFINIKLDDANEGYAAFKTLDIAKDNTYKITKSVWNGEKMTHASYKGTRSLVNYNGTAITGSNYVFTASQLAFNGASATNVRLANDIDLQGQEGKKGRDAWDGFDMSGTFECYEFDAEKGTYKAEKHTISNLDLQNGTGRGLVNTNTATVFKDLIIDGVTGAKGIAATSVGALIGTNSAAVTITDVEIKNIDIKSGAGAHSNYGGVIGNSTGVTTFKNVKVSGSIDAYSCIGGLIGTTSKAANIDGCDVSGISFKQTYDSGKAMDLNYAKVGGAIGNVSTNAVVTITDSKAPTTINYDKKAKMFTSNSSEEDGNFYVYKAEQNFIGYSGNNNQSDASKKIAQSKINGTEYDALAGWLNKTAPEAADLYHVVSLKNVYYLYTWPKKATPVSAPRRK